MEYLRKLLIFFILVSSITFASAADLSYVDIGDVVVFDQQNGAYINLTGQQNFSEFNFTAPTLNITINNSYSTYNNTANLTLSSVSYSNDKLNFTGSATSGTLNISAKMSSISTYYHLFIDNIKNTSVISDIIGVVNYLWSSWSSHLFSIQVNIAPSISNVTNQNVNEGQVVFVDIDGSDANGDTLTFDTNRSDLFTDFSLSTGKGNWTTNYTSSGNYSLLFNVTDGLSVTNQVMLINVSNVPLNISSFLPTSNPTITEGASQVFNTTLNRPANVAWLLNGIRIQYNSSVTVANYSNDIAGGGVHNVTANINESASLDTDFHTWSWTVQAVQSTTSTSKGGGGGSSISPATTETTDAWTDGKKDYTFKVLFKGFDSRVEPLESSEHGITALNMFFKTPTTGTYIITISTYTDYKPRLNGTMKYFSIMPSFDMKQGSSIELVLKGINKDVELYQLYNGKWKKVSKGTKLSTDKDKYRFPITSFGVFAVKEAGKQEVATNNIQSKEIIFDFNFNASKVFKNLQERDRAAYAILKGKLAWLVEAIENTQALISEKFNSLI